MDRDFKPRAAISAGVIAGTTFIVLEMLMVMLLQGESPWAPPRMMAAIAMGRGVLPPPATFDPVIMMVAMTIHFALSILLAAVLGAALSRLGLRMATAVVAGAGFGLAVYFVNFYGFTALFPWFAMARGPIGLFAHAVFGAVAAAAYAASAGRVAMTAARTGATGEQTQAARTE